MVQLATATPGEYQQLLYDWPIGGPTARDIISSIEMQHWCEGIARASSLTACYAALKSTSFLREDFLRHTSREIAAATACTRLGYGPFGISLRVELPRHRRIFVHCGSGDVDSVLHFVLNCSAHDGPRMRLLKTLREKLSPGFLTQLGDPASNPDTWLALLLHGELRGLGDAY